MSGSPTSSTTASEIGTRSTGWLAELMASQANAPEPVPTVVLSRRRRIYRDAAVALLGFAVIGLTAFAAGPFLSGGNATTAQQATPTATLIALVPTAVPTATPTPTVSIVVTPSPSPTTDRIAEPVALAERPSPRRRRRPSRPRGRRPARRLSRRRTRRRRRPRSPRRRPHRRSRQLLVRRPTCLLPGSSAKVTLLRTRRHGVTHYVWTLRSGSPSRRPRRGTPTTRPPTRQRLLHGPFDAYNSADKVTHRVWPRWTVLPVTTSRSRPPRAQSLLTSGRPATVRIILTDRAGSPARFAVLPGRDRSPVTPTLAKEPVR